MNWIGMGVMLICIITAINGYRCGFTKTVVSMLPFMVIVLAAVFLTPLVGGLIKTYINGGETTMWLEIAAFLVSLFISRLAVRLAGALLGGVAQIPPLRFFDKVGGLCLGFIRGLILVWIILFLITLISDTEVGKYLVQQIQGDVLANRLYESNPFMLLLITFLLL